MPRGDALRLDIIGNAAFRTRHDRNAQRLRRALGLDLVAHRAICSEVGPIKAILCFSSTSAKRAFSERKP